MNRATGFLTYFARPLLVLAFVFFFTPHGNSQTWKITRYESILGMGTAHYMGDVGSITREENFLGFKDLKFAHSRPSILLGARYKLYEKISVRLNMNFAWLGGDDAYGTYSARAIKFSTFIFEPSLQGEIAIIKDKSANNYLMMKSQRMNSFVSAFSVYGFAGFSPVFYWPTVIQHDPAGRTNIDTKHVSMAFPLGLGVRYGFNPKWKLALELGGRFTLTDYLDSFSPQSSKANDVYYLTQVHLTYVFKTNRKGFPEFW